MKHYFLRFFILFILTANSFSLDKESVKIKQSCQIPGGSYAELTVPQLPLGRINLKYDFAIEAKDKEHAVIDCLVKFPREFNVEFMSCDGVQALNLKDDGTVAALTIYEDGDYKCCEFLMPQKSGGTGFVEFQVDIDEKFKGENIPVEFNFEHFQKPFFMRYGTAIGIATGIAAGVVVGVLTFNPATCTVAGAAAGTATTAATTAGLTLVGSVALGTISGAIVAGGTSFISYNAIKESLQDMRKKYSAKKMNDSFKRFTLQIKG